MVDDIKFNCTLVSMKRKQFSIAAALLALASLAGGTSLDGLQSTYATQTARIEDDASSALAKLHAAYDRSLDSAIAALKKKGNPESVMAAIAENTRFSTEKTVPDPPDTELPQMVRDIQARYSKAVAAALMDQDKRLVALIQKYIGAIDRLMRKYTADGKMDLAMEVKAEKDRVAFTMANIESRRLLVPGKKPKEPEGFTHTIRVSGMALKRKWKKQNVKVPEGWTITITLEPARDGLKTIGYSHNCIRVRLGEDGAREYPFDTKGQYNWSTRRWPKDATWHYRPSLSLTASEDCSLYLWEEQGKRFAIELKVEPPEES
ncbi:MAG: hypothetical protein QGH42_02310 [Kiritimatiellia bacterium]|jgi:hypothetical protein|nr:hypothetical protein [Kiritimatiellia bacterium]